MVSTRSLATRLKTVTIRDLRLFWHAFRLGLTAQRITRGTPLEETIGVLLSRKRLPKDLGSQEALIAAERAGRRLETLGQLNSCLIRNLVTGTLLADRDGLTLRLGVQQGETPSDSISGHSWLTLGSRILPDPEEAVAPNGQPYLVMGSFPMRRLL